MLSFFILGTIRLNMVNYQVNRLSIYWGKNSLWHFWVCSDPEPGWTKQSTVLCFIGEKGNGEKVLVNFPLYPRLYYGDLLSIECRLDRPVVFPDFDYAAYLQVKGIKNICSWPEIVTLESGKAGSRFNIRLFQFKHQALFYLNYYLKEPATGLASALLLGYKKTLYQNEVENFRRAGLSHLIAISGAHISILLYLIINLFIYLGLYKQQALLPSYLLLCVYVFMTGLQASALRALIMGGLILYAWQLGRLERTINLLIMAAMVMLYINPLLWRYDLGFQLSFSALSGMIILQPIFNYYSMKYFRRMHSSFLRPAIETFYLSLAAQLFIWPIIAVQLGTVSLISPISNVFAFLIFGPLMFSLLIAVILSFIGLGSLLIFWPAFIFLDYLLIIARKFSSWPFSYIELSNFTWRQAILYYLLLFFLILVLKKRQRNKLVLY